MPTAIEGLGTALRVTLVTLVLTGFLYPLAMTPLAQLLFPAQARGSLVADERGQDVGSALLGQRFVQPAYFQGRPSAAGVDGYDAGASGGSNLGPTSLRLRQRAQAELARLLRQNPAAPSAVPVELITTSASGLDPHISPAAALWQVPRVAQARGVSEARIARLVHDRVQGRQLAILGEPRLNVLLLNLALDRQFGRPGG